MNKSEVIMRLMEAVSGNEPHQLPIDVEVGWTKRGKLRRVLPRIFEGWGPPLKVNATFTEEKRLLSSTFRILLVGPVKGLNQFSRIWETILRTEWHDDDPS